MSCIHPANAQYMDRARGTMTCALCGEVVADQQLELDPAFARGDRPAGGGANRAHQAGFARPNRTTVLQAPVAHRPSIENARRSIAAYARQLEVSSDFVDMAVALFKLAVNNNSIAGSRPSVLCACLYAICRKENTPHMLFDFAEASKESPFSILSNLKLICKSTNTTLPPPDPSFYVPRMVHELFKKLIRVVFGSDIDGNKELDHTRGPEVIVNFEVGKLLDRSRLLPIFEGAALYEVYCPESDSTTISYADEQRNLQAISADTLEEYRNAKIERDELLDNITILALKILHTMGQEWIGYGRRPVGLSAAAVLVACRNFGVEIALVALVGIAQLSPETIMMRVDEWTKTSAGNLHSIDDYRGASNNGLPPCYTRGLNPARIEKESRAIEKSTFFDMYFVICASVRANTPVNEHTARQWREFLLLAGKLKDLAVDEESLDLYTLSHARQLEILGITDAAPAAAARGDSGRGDYEGDAYRKSLSSDPMTAVIEELTQAHTGELAFRLAVSSFRGVHQQESTPGAAAAALAASTNQQSNNHNTTTTTTTSYLGSGMGTPTGSGFDFPTMPLSPYPNNNNGGGGMFPSVSSPDRFGGGGPAADEFEFDADPSTTVGGENHISSTSRAGSAAANMFLRKLGEQVKDVQALVNTDPRVSYAFKKAELTEEEQADADALVDAAKEVLQQANVEVLRLPEYESDTFNPFDYKNTDRPVPSFRKLLRSNSMGSSVGFLIGTRRSRSVETDEEISVATDGITDEETRMDRSRFKAETTASTKLGLVRSRRNTGQSETTDGGEPGPKKEEPFADRGSCPAYIDPRTYRAKDLAQYIISDLEIRLRKDTMMCKILGDRWSKAGAAKSMLTVKTLEFRACVSDIDLSDPSVFERNEPPQIPNLKLAAATAGGNPNSQWGSQMVEVDDDDFGDLGRADYNTQTQLSEVDEEGGGGAASSHPSISHEERVRLKKIELTKNLIHFSSDSSATYLALSKQDPQQFPTPHEFNKRSRPSPSLMVATAASSTMPPGAAASSDAMGCMTSQILAEDPNDIIKFQRTSLATIARRQVRKSKVGFITGHGSAQESLKHALRSRGGAQIDVTAVFGDADDDQDDIEVDGDGDFGGGGGADDDWI